MDTQSPTAVNDQQPQQGGGGVLAAYVVPALIVVGFLVVLLTVKTQTEAAAASLAAWLPVGYAFGAGMVASVNPCGFLMLPSYISYHLGTEEAGFYETPPLQRMLKALRLGAAATAGFVAVFSAVGIIIATGGQWLATLFPYGGAVIGVMMIGLGLWLLITHQTLGIAAATRVSVPPGKNLRNVFLFGIGYAIGSLGCTLPVFLVVVGSALVSRGLLNSLSQFVGYSLGMGTILVAVTVGAALFQGAVAGVLRKAIPYIHRLSAFFLIGAGAYMIYYWVFLGGFFF